MNDDSPCQVRAIKRESPTPTRPTIPSNRHAIDAALFSAELTALCAREPATEREMLALRALRVVRSPCMNASIERAIFLATCQCTLDAADALEPLAHTLALSTWAFVGAGDSIPSAIMAVISAGGDSEGAGAIVTGWLTVLHGAHACRDVTRAA